MITNDNELQVTQERIAYFQRMLATLRQTARPDEFAAVASGYRLEVERNAGRCDELLPAPSCCPC